MQLSRETLILCGTAMMVGIVSRRSLLMAAGTSPDGSCLETLRHRGAGTQRRTVARLADLSQAELAALGRPPPRASTRGLPPLTPLSPHGRRSPVAREHGREAERHGQAQGAAHGQMTPPEPPRQERRQTCTRHIDSWTLIREVRVTTM